MTRKRAQDDFVPFPIAGRRGSSQVARAGLVIIGIVIGAGLVFGALYATGSMSAGTVTLAVAQTDSVTETVTRTNTVANLVMVTTTLTTYTSVGGSVGYAQVSVIGTALAHGPLATGPTGSIYLQNTGTLNTVAENMTLSWGSHTCSPGVTATQVTEGVGSVAFAITGAGTCAGMASASSLGESFTGLIALSDGYLVQFSGVFS